MVFVQPGSDRRTTTTCVDRLGNVAGLTAENLGRSAVGDEAGLTALNLGRSAVAIANHAGLAMMQA